MRGLLACALAVATVGVAPVAARERAVRRYDAISHGVDRANALAEDHQGHLWVGDGRGVLRYDGVTFTRLHADVIVRGVEQLVAVDDGVAVLDLAGELYRVDEAVGARWPAPEAGARIRWIGPGSDGALLAIVGHRLWRATADAWVAIELPGIDAPTLAAVADGDLWVAAGRALWRVGRSGPGLVWTTPSHPIVALAPRADGELWIADFVSTHAWSPTSGIRTVLPADAPAGRRIAAVPRGESMWSATADALVVVPASGRPELVGVAEHLDSGGPLLVDHEGSLWLGTFRALYQFPEPDTAAWNRADGLPSDNVRRLTLGRGGLWLGAWGGGGRITLDRRGAGVAVDPSGAVLTFDEICEADDGTAWAVTAAGVERWDGARWRLVVAGGNGSGECGRAADGGVWMWTNGGLYLAAGAVARAVPTPWSPPGPRPIRHVLEDHAGWLWLGLAGEVCVARAVDVRGSAPQWRCQPVPGTQPLTGFGEAAPGEVWAAVPGTGVFAVTVDDVLRWRLIDDGTAARATQRLRSSPRGGVWRLGQGVIERVTPQAGRWDVVERPSVWHGVPVTSAQDVAEAADGRLWLATDAGVVEIPPAARDASVAPPPVRLVATLVDGRRQRPGPVAVGPHPDRVELRFAAASAREPARLRYRYRLRADAPWSAPTSEPVVTLVAPRAGHYQVQAIASLDGARWSAAATVVIDVAAPFWQRWYAWAAVAGLGALAGALAFGARTALVRHGQAQRLRLARDLHDEIGSGLGSIGLLAGVLREAAVPAEAQAGLVGRIAATVDELGASLSDLVWSLRDSDDTLGGVVHRLTARAHDLFADGATAVRAVLPVRVPDGPLAVETRRHLLLLGLEALHNAARHADATTVTVGLTCLRGRRYRLWIADDGRGLGTASAAPGSGLGLASMRARARAIGSELVVETSAAGTRIAVDVATLRRRA